jgi:hypothetical protein
MVYLSSISESSEWLSHQSVYHSVLEKMPLLLEVAAGNTQEADAATRHILAALALGEAWSAVERTSIWPLIAMGSSTTYAILRELKLQQESNLDVLSQVQTAIRGWMKDRHDYHQLLSLITQFQDDFESHLSSFTLLGLPSMREAFTDASWNQLQADVCQRIDSDLCMLVLGLVLATKSPPAQGRLLAALSPSLKAEWASTGVAAFNRHQGLMAKILLQAGAT